MNEIGCLGSSMDAAALEKVIAGQDAVISTLGPTRPPVPDMLETSAKNIMAAMMRQAVRRLVSTTGAGIRQPEDNSGFG
ncbi:MAG TPA: NAD(P)H-binding protein [Anaerolineales bacterium]|nr:NAD(P)H-binding protein [Anaerolineales bacterium]